MGGGGEGLGGGCEGLGDGGDGDGGGALGGGGLSDGGGGLGSGGGGEGEGSPGCGGGEVATTATRNGLKLKPCSVYEAAELPKNGKRRVVSLLPRLSVVSIIIATRHSAPAFHAASPLARAAYTPEPLPAATASRLPSEERPASAAPSSYSSE
eukprot:scaffold11673_cov47-Phaeocystis_antarctica.AAC.1